MLALACCLYGSGLDVGGDADGASAEGSNGPPGVSMDTDRGSPSLGLCTYTIGR